MELEEIRKLTNKQLNTKIAKILGWKQNLFTWWHDQHGDGPPPDYVTDLNAMQEAYQAHRDNIDWDTFSRAIIGKGWADIWKLEDVEKLFGTNARQQAEAFVVALK